jgi:hypothetical protein
MAHASLTLSASTAARLAPWPAGLATWLHWVPFQFRMSPPLPPAHTSLADTALRPCRTPLTGSETMLHWLPFQCSMTTGFPLPTAARAQTSAGEMAAMERIWPLLAVPVVSMAPGETLHCVPFQCSISGVTRSLAFIAEPAAQASVGPSALTAFSWPSGGLPAGEATWVQDWPFQCSMKLVLAFWPTAQMSLGPDLETPLSEDAEALAGAPETVLQVEPFHVLFRDPGPLDWLEPVALVAQRIDDAQGPGLRHAVSGLPVCPGRHRAMVSVDAPVGQLIQAGVEQLPVQFCAR